MKVESEGCVLSTQTITLCSKLSIEMLSWWSILIFISHVSDLPCLFPCVTGGWNNFLPNVSVSLLSIYSWLKIRNFKIALWDKWSMFNFSLARNVIYFAYKESQKSSSIFYSDIFHNLKCKGRISINIVVITESNLICYSFCFLVFNFFLI